jgi:dihydrofolate reductase
LPWHLPADLARFRRLTMGHCLIMGRKTFDSLEGRSLPGRRMVAITHQIHPEIVASGSMTARSLDDALALARDTWQETEAFIAGGGEIFDQALSRDLVDRMYLTQVQVEIKADTYFPMYDLTRWNLFEEELIPADTDNAYPLTFLTLERKPR